MARYGKPCKGLGSSRDCSFKVPLTSSECEVFNLKEKKVKSLFLEVSLMSKLYRNDVNSAFYISGVKK